MRNAFRILVCWSALAVAMALPASAAITYGGGSYSQDFDTLPTSGTANAWTNDVTLPGWFAFNSLTGGTSRSFRDQGTWNVTTNIRAGDGSSNAGALYSFGTGTATERALGSIGSGTPGDFVYALVLQNVSGLTYTGFTLTYDGEQWRDGGNADLAKHMLDFDYRLSSVAPANADLFGGNLTGYIGYEPSVHATDGSISNDKYAGTAPLGTPGMLDFPGPVGSATATALNGNLAGNRVAGITGSPSVTWPDGTYLTLRWWDNNSVGNDHALSIDNLSFAATPEPATLVLLGLGALAIRRRR